MTEAELKRKLAAIEAMVFGAMTEGERAAAQQVFETFKQKTPDETCQDLCFTVHDVWALKTVHGHASESPARAVSHPRSAPHDHHGPR